jgi:hypothetical protein
LTGATPEGDQRAISGAFDTFGGRDFSEILPGIERDFFSFLEISERE